MSRLRIVRVLLAALLLTTLWPAVGQAQQLPLTAGTIVTVNPAANAVTIADTAGGIAAYGVAPGAELIMYGRPARVADLLPGLSVWFYARDAALVYLMAPGEWQQIPPQVGTETTRLSGRLQYIDAKDVAVIRSDGTVDTFPTGQLTAAFRDGGPVALATLQPGDLVTLTFADAGQTDLVRIEAQSRDTPRVELLRARLQSVATARHELILQGVERLAQGRWQPTADWLRLPLAQRAELFLNGEPVNLATAARSGLGRTVYLAVSAEPGQPVLKASITGPPVLLFTATPAGVMYGSSELVFPDEYGTVATADSTILIRNGRLVDFFGLSAEGSFTVALASPPGTGWPGSGWPGQWQPSQLWPPLGAAGQFAVAAVQDTYMPWGLTLHWGRIEAVGGGEVELLYTREFKPYQFETTTHYASRSVRLKYGFAVNGRDWRPGQNGRSLDRLDLDWQPGLSKADPANLIGAWVVTASLGDQIVTFDVFPSPLSGGGMPNLLNPVVTAGTVTAASANSLALEEPVAWNSVAGRWEPENFSWLLSAAPHTVWLGPNGRIAPDDVPVHVPPGTPVTVIRHGSEAHIVIVR